MRSRPRPSRALADPSPPTHYFCLPATARAALALPWTCNMHPPLLLPRPTEARLSATAAGTPALVAFVPRSVCTLPRTLSPASSEASTRHRHTATHAPHMGVAARALGWRPAGLLAWRVRRALRLELEALSLGAANAPTRDRHVKPCWPGEFEFVRGVVPAGGVHCTSCHAGDLR